MVMENNCLVTKLKGSVDNDNLPYLNAIILRIKSNGDSWIDVETANVSTFIDCTVLTDGVKVAKNETHGTILADNKIRVSGNSGLFGFLIKDSSDQNLPNTWVDVLIESKYDLTCIAGFPKCWDYIDELSSINKINFIDNDGQEIDCNYLFDTFPDISIFNIAGDTNDKISCDFSKVTSTSLVRLSLYVNRSNLIGDISTIAGNPITYLVINSRSNDLYGDITGFKNKNMTRFIFDGTANLSGNFEDIPLVTQNGTVSLGRSNNIVGSIESYVARRRALGTTSMSKISFYRLGSNITFNGSQVNIQGDLSWTSNTITFNGVTINA